MDKENKEIINQEEINLSIKDKEMFKNTINKKGFFLEEKAFGILNQRKGFFLLRKNFIPGKYNKQFKDEIEIDLVFQQNDKNLIIECKKTDFTWVFSKSLVGTNNVNYIYEIDNKMFVRSFKEKLQACYSEPMAMMIKDNLNLIPENDKKEFVKTQSRQEDPIQRAVNRVLDQTKAWRWDLPFNKDYSFFIPIILTNASLLFLDYEEIQINEDSNLIDYKSLKKIGFLIYNYPKILDWPNAKNEMEFKSVFVVNIHYFTEFLDWILNQDMRELNSRK